MFCAVSKSSIGMFSSSSISGGRSLPSRYPAFSTTTSGSPNSLLTVSKPVEIESSDSRSSSTVMQSSPSESIAASSAEALGLLLVVSTTWKPSRANFSAMAPPTPHRIDSGNLSSGMFPPWTIRVLRPSDCHLDVAPITMATGSVIVHLLWECYSLYFRVSFEEP